MKSHVLRLLLLFGISVGCVVSNARADMDAPKVDPRKKATVAAPLPDQEILSLLHLNNKAEIAVAQLVPTHSTSQNIEDFSDRLQKDRKSSDLKVRALAGRLGLKLKEEASPQSKEDQRLIAREQRRAQDLAALKDAAFDQAFLAWMVRDHEKIIHGMERQKKRLPKDSPVYDLLAQLLPTLREHYQIALNLSNLPQ